MGKGGYEVRKNTGDVIDYIISDNNLPPLEPTVQARWGAGAYTEVPGTDKAGNPLLFMTATIPDLQNPGRMKAVKLDIFTYKVMMFKDQIRALKAKIGPLQKKASSYISAKKLLEEYIVERKAEYRRIEQKILSHRETAVSLQREYDLRLGRDFEIGDRAEVVLSGRIAAANSNVPSLPDYDSFVYNASVASVDQPNNPIDRDLRDLVAEYETKIDDLEGGIGSKITDDKIGPIKHRIEKYEAALKIANAEWVATRPIMP
jgi:hypothetical protein